MLQHFLDLIFSLVELEWTEFVEWSMDGWSLVFQIDLEFMTSSLPVCSLVILMGIYLNMLLRPPKLLKVGLVFIAFPH